MSTVRRLWRSRLRTASVASSRISEGRYIGRFDPAASRAAIVAGELARATADERRPALVTGGGLTGSAPVALIREIAAATGVRSRGTKAA